MYADHHGHLSILHGLKEALWHSISHTLSIDVFKVNAFPSRLITVAYGFLVMIITNTCALVRPARLASCGSASVACQCQTPHFVHMARCAVDESSSNVCARRRYTANLAAFLTVEQLDTNINSVTDLRARAVATVQPYVKRLYDNHRLTTTDRDSASPRPSWPHARTRLLKHAWSHTPTLLRLRQCIP